MVLDQPGRFMDRVREYAKQLESDVEQLRSAGRMGAKAADFCLGEQEALDALARFPLYMADAFTAGRYPPAHGQRHGHSGKSSCPPTPAPPAGGGRCQAVP